MYYEFVAVKNDGSAQSIASATKEAYGSIYVMVKDKNGNIFGGFEVLTKGIFLQIMSLGYFGLNASKIFCTEIEDTCKFIDLPSQRETFDKSKIGEWNRNQLRVVVSNQKQLGLEYQNITNTMKTNQLITEPKMNFIERLLSKLLGVRR